MSCIADLPCSLFAIIGFSVGFLLVLFLRYWKRPYDLPLVLLAFASRGYFLSWLAVAFFLSHRRGSAGGGHGYPEIVDEEKPRPTRRRGPASTEPSSRSD